MTNRIRITAYLQATNRGYIQRQEIAVEAATRSAVTYGLALGSGAALFFLIFAAVFNGVWSLLILFLLGYAVVGFLGVRKGGASPLSPSIEFDPPSRSVGALDLPRVHTRSRHLAGTLVAWLRALRLPACLAGWNHGSAFT
jgi:hypothetical protein